MRICVFIDWGGFSTLFIIRPIHASSDSVGHGSSHATSSQLVHKNFLAKHFPFSTFSSAHLLSIAPRQPPAIQLKSWNDYYIKLGNT